MPSEPKVLARKNANEPGTSSRQSANPVPAMSQAASTRQKTISCTLCRKRKLKCDRVKPSCATCTRLRRQCIYPEVRAKVSSKTRNVKDLEARLAQVETLLASEAARNGSPSRATIDCLTESSSHELIRLGLLENLPSREITDELHQIYFGKVHIYAPIIHKYRYLANVNLSPSLGPPLCLRYIIWALAAAHSDKYTNLQKVFYERARKYAEGDEMKSQGECSLTIGHVQCWSLITTYEVQNMYLSRAWVSGGRSVRMAQMMRLHRLDGVDEDVKHTIAPPRDWMELEERRRTFWATFRCDRHASLGSGWPMIIDEKDIFTNLPASEEAFDQGKMQMTPSLAEALAGEGCGQVSSYAGVVLIACLMGHYWLHLHRSGPRDHPENLSDGEFWKRHRKLDNMLSNMTMLLSQHIKLLGGVRNPIAVHLSMHIHASAIRIHQSAIMTAKKHDLDPEIIKQSQARCLMAAEEIINIMRLQSGSDMDSWMSYNLYPATIVLIEGCRNKETSQRCLSNLELLLEALQTIGTKQVLTKAFITQFEIALEVAGMSTYLRTPKKTVNKSLTDRSHGPPEDSSGEGPRICAVSVHLLNESIFSLSVSCSHVGTQSSSQSPNDSTTTAENVPNRFAMEGFLPELPVNTRLWDASDGQDVNSNLSLEFGTLSRHSNDQPRSNLDHFVNQTFDTLSSNTPYPTEIQNDNELQQSNHMETMITQFCGTTYITTSNTSNLENPLLMPSPPYPQQHVQPDRNMGIEPNNVSASNSAANAGTLSSGWMEGSYNQPMPPWFSELEYPLTDREGLMSQTQWDFSG